MEHPTRSHELKEPTGKPNPTNKSAGLLEVELKTHLSAEEVLVRLECMLGHNPRKLRTKTGYKKYFVHGEAHRAGFTVYGAWGFNEIVRLDGTFHETPSGSRVVVTTNLAKQGIDIAALNITRKLFPLVTGIAMSIISGSVIAMIIVIGGVAAWIGTYPGRMRRGCARAFRRDVKAIARMIED